MTVDEPLCETCKHLWKDEIGYKCNAFPMGIPDDIFIGEFDHHNSHENDQGIQYEKEEEGLKMDKECKEIIYDRFNEEVDMEIILPAKKVKKSLDEVPVDQDKEENEVSDL